MAISRAAVLSVLLFLAGCNDAKPESAKPEAVEELLQTMDEAAHATEQLAGAAAQTVQSLEKAGLQGHAEKVTNARVRLQSNADRLKELRAKVPPDRVISKAFLDEFKEANADGSEAMRAMRETVADARQALDERKRQPKTD